MHWFLFFSLTLMLQPVPAQTPVDSTQADAMLVLLALLRGQRRRIFGALAFPPGADWIFGDVFTRIDHQSNVKSEWLCLAARFLHFCIRFVLEIPSNIWNEDCVRTMRYPE